MQSPDGFAELGDDRGRPHRRDRPFALDDGHEITTAGVRHDEVPALEVLTALQRPDQAGYVGQTLRDGDLVEELIAVHLVGTGAFPKSGLLDLEREKLSGSEVPDPVDLARVSPAERFQNHIPVIDHRTRMKHPGMFSRKRKK